MKVREKLSRRRTRISMRRDQEQEDAGEAAQKEKDAAPEGERGLEAEGMELAQSPSGAAFSSDGFA